MNDEKEKIYHLFNEIVGEGACGNACTEAEIYKENGEWKLFLCGFMEPWPIGKTLTEVEDSLREYARQRF